MSTNTTNQSSPPVPDWWKTLVSILKPIASLKLTVVLFAASFFIVLAGTFAQVDYDIWKVIDDYFRVDMRSVFSSQFPWINFQNFFVWITPGLFFPPAFAPGGPPNFPEWLGIWFPKGWAIGTLMMFNLFAAHLISFRVQASGKRLAFGWGVIAIGAIATYLVILSGSSTEGLQAKPILSYESIWTLIQICIFGLSLISLYFAITSDSSKKAHRYLFGGLAIILAAFGFLSFQSDGSNESTMRILYQVLKATFAGVVLLAGCVAVFKKRAGIVLLHSGIGLMMVYDVVVGVGHVESQMHIVEGDTNNFSRDMRESELAIFVPSNGNQLDVTVIDARKLQKPGTVITDERIPFNIEVISYFPNSTILGPMQELPEGAPKENPATHGYGKTIRAVSLPTSAGTDTQSTFDIPTAYLKLTAKDGKDLGTYMFSGIQDANTVEAPEKVTVDGKDYEVVMRFERIYYDYNVKLNKVEKVDYAGTSKPKDYSSFITLNNPGKNETFNHRIWMNNPMRYQGKTFYQSGYNELSDGQKMTTLQVVDNAGWMTPYVSCMMVVVGMLYHFGMTLLRFLQRRLRANSTQEDVDGDAAYTPDGPVPLAQKNKTLSTIGWGVTGVIVAGVAFAVLYAASVPKPATTTFDYYRFGQLPLWYKGRAQPLDSFARNALLQLSDYQSFKLEKGDKKSQPAIRWLLELMANEKEARQMRVIRIENDELRSKLGLKNENKFAYSIDELAQVHEKIRDEAIAADKTPAKNRSLIQKKTLELANRIIFYSFLENTLGQAPQVSPPDKPLSELTTMQRASRAQEYFQYIKSGRAALENLQKELPLVIPFQVGNTDDKAKKIAELNNSWETPMISHIYDQFYSEIGAPKPPALQAFMGLLRDYRDGDFKKFNQQIAEYEKLLNANANAEELPIQKINFEAWYNKFAPFDLTSWLYVFAFVLTVIGWLNLPIIFNRAAVGLIVLLLLVHTFALVARIYISGRPPVTNLYSSAVFIGWGTVVFGLVIERLTKLGIGSAIASAAGFMTLRIASGLAGDGDTFVVLEAVLDTQFWLATHVVCITLGYAATFVAGMLGVLYVLLGMLTPQLGREKRDKEVIRMLYGTVCFAIFFSFWGTVLGGLWADDSWGRFWGWDPKENGALLIVIWLALILHARWGRLVNDRGLAVLAILGNVVTAWSWFGVNELGVGLHSYGFTEGRLQKMGQFMFSQLAICLLAQIPQKYWWSFRKGEQVATAEEVAE
ncbi:cytochrome c biogenesis protein CcsA [Planctomicrobium sp. SH668]|uniref:cytochrome c biogenesis protein n=1 Tax=Planctomicrobium sp. SH668 TaxID=3448126 RepID=UPI003F5B4EF5